MSVILSTQIKDSTRFESVYNLDDFSYGFRFYTNNTDGYWYFDIFDPEDMTDTIVGFRIVNSMNMLYRFKYKPQNKIPRGYLILADKNTLTYTPGIGFSGILDRDPSIESFKSDLYQLVYVSLSERK